MYTEIKNSNLLRSQQIRPRKQILPKQKKFNPVTHLHCLYFIRLIHNLPNHSVGLRSYRLRRFNWISPKHNFMQHTRVFGCRGPVAANLHVAFLCLKGIEKQNKKNPGRSFCVSKKICVLLVYFTSKSWRQIWWCVNQSFKYTFYQCFYTYDLRKTVLCLCACF